MGQVDVMTAVDEGEHHIGDVVPERPGRRHHRVRWTLLGILGVALAFALVSAGLAYRGRAREVSIQQAAGNYHPGASDPSGAHPLAGVYSYTGTGTDQLSLPPLSQPEGPTLPGTVEATSSSCWSFRIDFSTNHWQSWIYCRSAQGLEQTGEQIWQRWMIGPVAVTNLSSLHCDPGAMALPATRTVGQSWPVRCKGRSTEIAGNVVSTGSNRYLGETLMMVSGHKVRVAHISEQWTLSGAQVGPQHDDIWFDTATGLPIENRRSIRVRTATPFGTSTYTESGQFLLRSVKPTT
ncbi:MAG: hypothetical protein ABSC41_14985 [Acidimicrobiales bacterium]|jgi:hypothetical protein